ncbi:MAG: patatin-like phospholipase family protein [Acidobacteriota bacterium]|nr:patatin-like phospholipase family protein [Acidobacteriota bacterium]MDH3523595.1 patatin-like phospholipase family protein [Acidobacteriota bacterium]
MSYRVPTRDEHLAAGAPKRILALDGGGLRGILTLRLLAKVETLLRARHGGAPDFRLCHYYDLIAGTSTGAIIAAALAQGMAVEDLSHRYMELGSKVFAKSRFRLGLFRARYDKQKLVDELKTIFGEETRLGGEELRTGLLVVTKRMDTGSPWPLGNAPGRYSRPRAGATWIPNFEYRLWQVVRASTAAPVFFQPERIRIAEQPGRQPVDGEFVDGGVSPHNNPSLQALMYATIGGYREDPSSRWETGADKLFLTSVGTGRGGPAKGGSKVAAKQGVAALVALMDDCSAQVETMMQWMSSSSGAREIDSEIGNLENDHLAGEPLLTYRRFDVPLTAASVESLLPGRLDARAIATLADMDRPENMQALYDLGDAADLATDADFPAEFDLPAA